MPSSEQIIGRYALHAEIASGGMATVHIGRLLGPVGFSRTVAVKRLHPQFAKDPEFVSMFLDEARLAARIRHRNVVSVLDVVALSGELFLVMDYVEGEPLSRLLRLMRQREEKVALPIACSVVNEGLLGLHAAHEAQSAQGTRLNIVHRDVSPQNLLVGADGSCRVVDFGVAKAANRLQTTRDGQLKGKISYMSPEQIQSRRVDRRTDVYAAGVVLWELLVGRRLWRADEPAAVMAQIITQDARAPSKFRDDIPQGLDDVVLKALSRDPDARFQSAKEMALSLEAALRPATTSAVANWVATLAGDSLRERAQMVARIERYSDAGLDLGAGRPSFTGAEVAPPPVPLSAPESTDEASGVNVTHRLPRSVAISPQKWIVGGVAGVLMIGMLAASSLSSPTPELAESSLGPAVQRAADAALSMDDIRAEAPKPVDTTPVEPPKAEASTSVAPSASVPRPPKPKAGGAWPSNKSNKWDRL